MASSTMLMKVKHGETLRRFNAHVDENDQLDMDMGGLRFKICGLFGFKLDDDFTMTYVDEDGDVVTLVNDEDLRDALKQDMKFLRIDVHRKVVKEGKSDVKTIGGSTRFGHHKVLGEILSQVPRESPMDSFTALVESFAKMTKPKRKVGGVSGVKNDSSEKPVAPSVTAVKNDSKSETILKSPTAESNSKNSQTMDVQNVAKDVGISVPSQKASVDLNVMPADSNPSKPADTSVSQVGASLHAAQDSKEAQKVSSGKFKGNSVVNNPAPIGFNLPNPFKRLPAEVSGGMFHTGVRCDGCGCHPIVGPRFKSVVKEDYDLCRICHSSMSNLSEFIRIDHPESYRHPRPSKGTCEQPPLTGPPVFTKTSHVLSPASGQSGVRLERPKLESCFWQSGARLERFRQSGVRLEQPKLDTRFGESGVRLERPKLDSRFVLDVNVKDGTLMAPYTSFTKIWRMRNNGGLIWPKGTQLLWIGGDKFSKSDSVDIEISANGMSEENEVDIAVDFTAPGSPGRYISYWRMASPSGQKFGQRVWVLIQVDASLKYSLFQTCVGWNLNLPPIEMVNFPQQHVSCDSAESSSSNSVKEAAISVIKVKLENEQDVNFPITNSLLVGDMPIVDMFEPAPSSLMSSIVATPISSERTSLDTSLDNPVEDTLLKELEEMGFKQVDLNKEILRRNEYNFEQAVDDLCDATEWDPILEELQKMGFSDVEKNKKLLTKNNGSIKQVVMDLINGDNEQ